MPSTGVTLFPKFAVNETLKFSSRLIPSQIHTAPASKPPDVMFMQFPDVDAEPIALYAPGTQTKSDEVISKRETPLTFTLWARVLRKHNNPRDIVTKSLVKSYSLDARIYNK